MLASASCTSKKMEPGNSCLRGARDEVLHRRIWSGWEWGHRDVEREHKVTSHLTPHTSHLTPHTSHLTPHTQHLTHNTSHTTPHTSHTTPHTSHLTHHLTPHTQHLTPHTSHTTPHNSPEDRDLLHTTRTMKMQMRHQRRRARDSSVHMMYGPQIHPESPLSIRH